MCQECPPAVMQICLQATSPGKSPVMGQECDREALARLERHLRGAIDG